MQLNFKLTNCSTSMSYGFCDIKYFELLTVQLNFLPYGMYTYVHTVRQEIFEG